MYQYTRLRPRQIRIIQLHPGNFGTPLVADLQLLDLDEARVLQVEDDLEEPLGIDL